MGSFFFNSLYYGLMNNTSLENFKLENYEDLDLWDNLYILHGHNLLSFVLDPCHSLSHIQITL